MAVTRTQKSVALRIDAGVLGHAAEFVSHEETRYYINGVYVEPAKEGVLAVATDGHRLIVVHDPKGYIARPAIIRAAKSVWAKCRVKYNAILTVADLGGKEVSAPMVATLTPEKGAAETVLLDEIDGTFPDWRKVFPVTFPATGGIPCFQGRHLASFDALARVGGNSGAVRVVSRGNGEPAVVTPGRDSQWPWIGVLMPIYDSDRTTTYPTWLGLAQKKVRVKAGKDKAS